MADIDYTLNLNFNFNSSGKTNKGQSVTSSKETSVVFSAFNYVFQDIAFYAAKKQQTELRQQLEERFANIVRQQLVKMGQKIASQAVGIGSRQRGPVGRLALDGPFSSTLQSLGLSPSMSLQAYTGAWAERSKKYLAWKRRKFGHTQWFKNTNQLRQQLRNASTYTSSFGPVRVKFQANEIPAGSQSVRRISTLATPRGRPSGRISVGEIQVSVLGRITDSMLADPNGHSYDSRFTGLFDMLPDDIAYKLGGPPDHRPVIEPFLSFYLTRQIPNAVFKAIEDSTRDRLSGLRGQRAFTG